MLTTEELIERMTPSMLAEMIAAIWDGGNCNMDQLATVIAMRDALVSKVGQAEASKLVAASN